MDLATLTTTYVTPAPPLVRGTVTPLLDTEEYHQHLFTAIGALGQGSPADNESAGEFIYVAGWWLSLVGGAWIPAKGDTSAIAGGWGATGIPPYPSDDPKKPLVALLSAKAKAGVDVRVMGWCHFAVLNEEDAMKGVPHIAAQNMLTLESIVQLRAGAVGPKAILNVIHHTAGAAHAKLVVVGNNTAATGFTGGLDFVTDRIASTLHLDDEPWHDAMAKVEGDAVQGLHDWFNLLWTENLKKGTADRAPVTFRTTTATVPHVVRPSAPGKPATPPAVTRTFKTGTGKHHVQSLRTLPAHNYDTLTFAPHALPVSGWPRTGEFLLRDAWEKAISAAETYIYMEDQALYSTEVLGWINARVRAKAALRVLLLGSGEADPNDPSSNEHPWLCQSIENTLYAGLTAAQRDQIRIFRRWGEGATFSDPFRITKITVSGATTSLDTDMRSTRHDFAKDELAGHNFYVDQGGTVAEIVSHPAVPKGTAWSMEVKTPTVSGTLAVGPAIVKRTQGIVVHTKTTLVDDHWAILGSANCMRRSLYTDLEHSVAWVDEDDVAIKEYRKALWAHHFVGRQPSDFDDIQHALHAWEQSWGTPGTVTARPQRGADTPGPEYLEPMPALLNCPATLSDGQQRWYDLAKDTDSRQSWGFLQRPVPQ